MSRLLVRPVKTIFEATISSTRPDRTRMKRLFVLAVFLLVTHGATARDITIVSPDTRLKAVISVKREIGLLVTDGKRRAGLCFPDQDGSSRRHGFPVITEGRSVHPPEL